MSRLYPPALEREMKNRIYSVDVSTDGGRTFTQYSSAGAFIKATGRPMSPGFRAKAIEENGGIEMQVGDSTPKFIALLTVFHTSFSSFVGAEECICLLIRWSANSYSVGMQTTNHSFLLSHSMR
jgi:hypothetical protein